MDPSLRLGSVSLSEVECEGKFQQFWRETFGSQSSTGSGSPFKFKGEMPAAQARGSDLQKQED